MKERNWKTLLKKHWCVVFEDDEGLDVSLELTDIGDYSEPQFVQEISSLFKCSRVDGFIRVPLEHKEELLNIAATYFYTTTLGKRRIKGTMWREDGTTGVTSEILSGTEVQSS